MNRHMAETGRLQQLGQRSFPTFRDLRPGRQQAPERGGSFSSKACRLLHPRDVESVLFFAHDHGAGRPMTEMTIELSDELAEAIEQKAAALGTTPDQLLSAVVTEAVAEIPELEADDDWQYR
ncbi:hypothetical protein [Roseomonas chloroacetimidivorans]|uniref:hypothetical protein n=1 Tax=Roseomonas chloroacetimidivorans TaxID=1766656 RepID=UPI003C75DFFD